MTLDSEEEVDESQHFKEDKDNFVELFESYTCLGLTKRKKRLRLFQQNLINKRNANKLKKMNKIFESAKKNRSLSIDLENGTLNPAFSTHKPILEYYNIHSLYLPFLILIF